MHDSLHMKFKVGFHKPFEFLATMYTIANWDLFEQFHLEVGGDIKDVSNAALTLGLKSQLSRYLLQELEFFFRVDEPTSRQVLLDFIYENPNVETVGDFVRCIDDTSEKGLIVCLLKMVPEEALSAELRKQVTDSTDESVCADVKEKLELFQQTHHTSGVERLIECLNYPSEAKQRLCMLLSRFYSVYQPMEEKFEEISKQIIPNYEDMLDSNPDQFFERYFKLSPSVFTKETRIHVSSATPWGTMISFTDTRHDCPNWILLSAYSEQFVQHQEDHERVEQFLKAVADKRRMEIIRRLSDRSMYGQEIAQALELTPASVTYHMNFLIPLDIVIADKVDNRIYYSLQADMLANLFDLSKQMMVTKIR